MTEINNIKCLKIPNGRRQTSWLFTQCSRGVRLGVTMNKSSEWQDGGLEPGTTRLQVQHPIHSVTPPPILHIEMLCGNFIIVETEYNIFKNLCLSHYNRNQHPLI